MCNAFGVFFYYYAIVFCLHFGGNRVSEMGFKITLKKYEKN